MNPFEKELYQRISEDLGWTVSSNGFSLLFLREMIKSEKLKNDITEFIRTGKYLTVQK